MIKFSNKCGNTVYLDDIEYVIPFYEDFRTQEMSLDDTKRSKLFQLMLKKQEFEIEGIGESLFERNLMRKVKSYKEPVVKSEDTDCVIQDNDVEVSIKGHFYDLGGYSKVNQNLARGLYNLGVNVSIEPMNESKIDIDATELSFLSRLKKKPSKNAIHIDSMIPTFGSHSLGNYKILYTTIESSTIPKQFVDALSSYNEIWVTSDFCKEVLKKEAGRDSLVFENTFDINKYSDKGAKYSFDPPIKNFVFGGVFSWNYRKGYDALIRAYLNEFSSEDPVTLLLVTRNFHNPKKNVEIKKYIDECLNKSNKNNPKISRCSSIIPESKMPELYRSFDAYCLLSRGEGFGMPYAEAALCGTPVIATNHSGHSMFLKKDNSTLVEIDRLRKIESGMMEVHYWDDQYFADLTSKDFIDRAGKSMRDVFENYKKAVSKNNKLKNKIKKDYNINSVASRVNKRLKEIREHMKCM